MVKKRTMNELRQTKEYKLSDQGGTYNVPYKGAPVQEIMAQQIDEELEKDELKGYSEIDIETTKDLIFNQLKNQLFDIMFQAVCDEMNKHEVFQEETYFTPQGMDWFEDQWFEFYHEHHGDILGSIMKDFTN